MAYVGRGDDDSGTYLEDFLETLAPMPADIQRNFHLMQALDEDVCKLQGELLNREKEYLRQGRKKVAGCTDPTVDKAKLVYDEEAMNEINRLRALIKQKAEQKIDIADLISETLEAHMRHLRGEMEKFQRELEQNGDYERVAGRVGEQVAFKQSPYETHYVLGTVVAYRSDMGQYDVRDADDADGGGVYPLNETLVVLLNNGADSQRFKFSKGDEVFAVYPETTSFYVGTISQAPRRAPPLPGEVPRLAIQFQDDADEAGNTPVRWVPVHHVFKL